MENQLKRSYFIITVVYLCLNIPLALVGREKKYYDHTLNGRSLRAIQAVQTDTLGSEDIKRHTNF